LGIDYAEALTGFEFRGRHGTAVLRGVVVAAEYQEAVEAIIAGFKYEREREREYEHEKNILNMWRRFYVGLRIKNRVDAYASDGEVNDENLSGLSGDYENGNAIADDKEYIDDGEEGGGFFPE
jgi:xeroderma pigmentosum group C-complementing protein